jgi:hypothetical protein
MRHGVELVTLHNYFTGSANSVFPNMARLDTISFREWMLLTAVNFALTTENQIAGAFIILDHTEPVLTLSSSLNIVAQRFSVVPSKATAQLSTSKMIFFFRPLELKPSQPISLYATAPVGINARLTCSTTVFGMRR